MITADPAARCPACGNDNRCALAADAGAGDCWCRQVDAQLPLPAPAAACYCRACLAQAAAEPPRER